MYPLRKHIAQSAGQLGLVGEKSRPFVACKLTNNCSNQQIPEFQVGTDGMINVRLLLSMAHTGKSGIGAQLLSFDQVMPEQADQQVVL